MDIYTIQRLATPFTVGEVHPPTHCLRLHAADLPPGDVAILEEAARHYGLASRVELLTDLGPWVFNVRAPGAAGTPFASFLLASAGMPRPEGRD